MGTASEDKGRMTLQITGALIQITTIRLTSSALTYCLRQFLIVGVCTTKEVIKSPTSIRDAEMSTGLQMLQNSRKDLHILDTRRVK
jgi:hypothetical protein